MRPVGVIILTAGKGTRMRSPLPRVAHQIAGRAMLEHAMRAAAVAVVSADASSAGVASAEESGADDGSDHSRHSTGSTRLGAVVGRAAPAMCVAEAAASVAEAPRAVPVPRELMLGGAVEDLAATSIHVGCHLLGVRMIGERAPMRHFNSMGDASVGADSNGGASTISMNYMNYDGKNKHRLVIGERVFLGSGTRAPGAVGDDATTGAGSVAPRDAPAGALVVETPARVARRVLSHGQGTADSPAESPEAVAPPDAQQSQAQAESGGHNDPPRAPGAARG